MECKDCGSIKIKIGVTNTTSGSTVYPYYCNDCGTVFTQYAKKQTAIDFAFNHGNLKYVKTKTAKLIEDGKINQNKCEVCGGNGVEYHHWAPTHLFGDEADKWPCSYLCRACHKKWHDIVTPNMSNKDQL